MLTSASVVSNFQTDYKISLHRTFAKLYEVKNDFKEAINELKVSCEAYLKEVYRRCLKYLPEHDRKTAEVKNMLLGMNVDVEGEAF
ncbi:unnamed protein product [Sphagnum balticum]